MQFRIKERSDGTWQWRLIDGHGNVITNCARPYSGKGAVLEAIEQVRKAAGAIVLGVMKRKSGFTAHARGCLVSG
jgi:uncharacterized protein YegP (UPF0339 family)